MKLNDSNLIKELEKIIRKCAIEKDGNLIFEEQDSLTLAMNLIIALKKQFVQIPSANK